MGVFVPRAIALFLLAFGIAMAIAALADTNWADNPQLDGAYGKYQIGLRQWEIVNKRTGEDCPSYDLDELGAAPCEWSNTLLGDQGDWKSAGEGALGIGAIGVILLGFAAIFTLVSLVVKTFPKWPGAFSAFLSGVAFVIGALIFDSARPTWGGDMGYNYPMGLYLAAGLMGEIAAIAIWSADYLGEEKRAQYA
jgi:hypothetical protein